MGGFVLLPAPIDRIRYAGNFFATYQELEKGSGPSYQERWRSN
jgi:hypothetical protein